MGIGGWGLGIGSWGWGCRGSGLGLGEGFRLEGIGSRVQGWERRVRDLGDIEHMDHIYENLFHLDHLCAIVGRGFAQWQRLSRCQRI